MFIKAFTNTKKFMKNLKNIYMYIVLITTFLFSFYQTGCNNSTISYTQGNKLNIHYIDVGQADSIIIQSPNNKNMLIDAGETKNNAIKNYLDSLGITKLDVIVATHPHSDHMSEMADIINSYDIGEFYMPNATNNTKGFEKMIDALSNKNIKANQAKAGVKIDFDKDTDCYIIAPCKDKYDDLNNYSAVIKLVYGNNSFLFTGDAESKSESEIIENNTDIKADVLKVGHHGSHTSTSDKFLEAVNPKYAIISAGKDNEYGHPHKETIDKLEKNNIKTYITYSSGTITVTSDGNNINITEENNNNQ